MSVSSKVSASTVGASLSTLVIGILNVHVFPHSMAPDVQGLVSAVVVALCTFAAGYLTREATRVESDVKAEVSKETAPVAKAVQSADVVWTRVEQAAPPVEQVAAAIEKEVKAAVTPVLPTPTTARQ